MTSQANHEAYSASYIAQADRARQLVTLYRNLSGLRVIPWGILLMMAALTTGSIITGPPHTVIMYMTLPALVAAPVASWAIDQRYRNRFGALKPLPRFRSVWPYVGLVLAAVLVIQGIGTLRTTPLESNTPISLSYAVLWSLFAVGSWLAWRRTATHWTALCIGVVLFALTPLERLQGVEVHPLSSREPYGLLILGLVLIVGGLMDHRVLVHTFADKEASEGGNPPDSGSGTEVR